jgi:DNA-binding NarL/FixJ family response regulator
VRLEGSFKLIRLGIVDDHPVFRLGLRRSFERQQDLEVMWDLGSATNLLETIAEAPVDVVLMDLDLGSNQDGLSAIRSLQEAKPKPRVVVITASMDAVSVAESKRAGASGYLAKDLPVADLVAAVRQLAAPGAELAVFGHHLTNGNGWAWTGGRGLTKREQEVLGELNRGRTNREIAMTLGVSVTTVNKHVQQVLKKLHVRNRGQAVARLHAGL